MQELRPFWELHERIWVTFRTPTSQSILQNENIYWAWSPTNRNLPNLIRNFCLAWRVLRRERPSLVLSSGAGVAVPFIILGKLFGFQTAFVESITRVEQLSLSARLVYPFLDALYVHWSQLCRYKKAELIN